jgi:hypothetical protein
MKRRTHKKGYRKYNLFESTYAGYKRAFSNAVKSGRLMPTEAPMSKEDFYSAAISAQATYTDGDGVMRFDPAKLRKVSAQAIATATGTLTTEQARHLKAKLIRMGKAGWTPESLAGRDISSIPVSEFRANKRLVSEIYNEMIRNGWSTTEANQALSSDIFGSP